MRTMSDRADLHVVKVPVVFKITRRMVVAAWIADRVLRLRAGRDAYRGIVLALEEADRALERAILFGTEDQQRQVEQMRKGDDPPP